MVGLRLKGGIERATFLSLTGRQPEDALDRKALARLVEAGLAASDGAGVRLTSEGRTRLDSAVRLLLG